MLEKFEIAFEVYEIGSEIWEFEIERHGSEIEKFETKRHGSDGESERMPLLALSWH